MAAPPRGQFPSGFQQVELASEEKNGRWDDVGKEREEASGYKLRNQFVLGSHIVQQSDN